MKKHALVAFVAVFATFAAIGSAQAASLTRSEATLLRAVNVARTTHGLRALRVDTTLARAARAHSTDMLRHQYFAHGAFVQRLSAFGARGPHVGENLAWGVGSYATASAIVRSWLASPEHRANLLRRGFRRIGIGAVRGSFQGYGGAVVVTADFGGW